MATYLPTYLPLESNDHTNIAWNCDLLCCVLLASYSISVRAQLVNLNRLVVVNDADFPSSSSTSPLLNPCFEGMGSLW